MRLLCVLSLLLLTISTAATGQTKSPMALFPATEIEWKDGPPSLPKGAKREEDRKSTRLNSSHTVISYAVFCLKKKKKIKEKKQSHNNSNQRFTHRIENVQ